MNVIDTTTFTLANSSTNASLPNVTDHPALSSSSIYDDVLKGLKYVDLVFFPSCLILGVVGNFITIIVMNTKQFDGMASRYFLIALALSDSLLLLTQPLNKAMVMDSLGTDLRAVSNLGCKLYFWFFKNGKMTSSWFVVFLCLERFTAVQFPFRVKSIFSKRHCIIAVVVVYLVMGVYNGIWSWAHNIKEDGYCYPDGINKTDPATVNLFRDMLIGGLALYSIVPICIMSTITPLIVVILNRSFSKRSELTANNGKDKDLARITAMLLSIVIGYIILVTPVTVLHLMSFYLGLHAFGDNPKPFEIFRDVSQMLEQLNYTINFFLYAVSNPKFRRAVIQTFSCQLAILRRSDKNNAKRSILTRKSTTNSSEHEKRSSRKSAETDIPL